MTERMTPTGKVLRLVKGASSLNAEVLAVKLACETLSRAADDTKDGHTEVVIITLDPGLEAPRLHSTLEHPADLLHALAAGKDIVDAFRRGE